MRILGMVFSASLAMLMAGVVSAQSPQPEGGKDAQVTAAAPAGSASGSGESNLEGEKRFRSNCGRCHVAPPKFAPRMMGTIVRHMRVRATITDEEMRLILKYMTQ